MSSVTMVGENYEKDQIMEEHLECCAKELGHLFTGRGEYGLWGETYVGLNFGSFC